MKTTKAPLTVALVDKHLAGSAGIGTVPILDDNYAVYGAIDIDIHGPNAQNVSVERVAAAVQKFGLPLIACRSKSGGVHCYAFWLEPQPAGIVQDALRHWAVMLGYPSAELFPKQRKLPKDALGNWINLPYFKAAATERYAVIGGKRADLEHFLETAEALRMDGPPALAGGGNAVIDLTEAPPCLQRLYDEKCAVGERNKAMFQAVVWLKRQHPDDWKTYAAAFNEQGFERPLAELELKKILGSVERKEYSYRCKDEPCVSRCDRTTCLTRKFGIKPLLDYYAPPVEKVLVVNSDPPRYIVKIYEHDVMMDSKQLLIPYLFRQRVFEITGELLKVPTKEDQWHEFLVSIKSLFEQTEAGQGTRDVFLTNFRQIAQDAMTDKQEPDEKKRRAYVRDTGPATIRVKDTEMLAFKFAHLEKRLKQQYAMYLTSSDLAAYLRTLVGAESHDISIEGRSERVWIVDHQSLTRNTKPVTLNLKTDY